MMRFRVSVRHYHRDDRDICQSAAVEDVGESKCFGTHFEETLNGTPRQRHHSKRCQLSLSLFRARLNHRPAAPSTYLYVEFELKMELGVELRVELK